MSRKKIFRIVKIVIIIYVLVGLIVYFVQDYIILQPIPLAKNYKYAFNMPYEETSVSYNANSNISIVKFTTANPKGIVLYFHGNRSNIARYRRFVPYFTKSGYEVWMIDYPGYGKSTGKFSENLVFEWSLQMYKMARTRFNPDHIVIFGKSLGTGIASQLASVRNCRCLMLESPYYSLPAIFQYYLPMYPMEQIIRHQIPTYTFLPKVTDPVIMFHGTNDWLVPYRNSERLSVLLKKGDKLITLEGGTHRNLFSFPIVPATIDSVLAN
ncbi:MAG: alpha/beta fold hydrolase [Chitinophagaceae bacterium]